MSKRTKTAVARSAQAGFTLVELIVAVAIVGLLAAIAYPAYTRNIIKSNRTAAQSYMFTLTLKEEQFFLDNRQYTSEISDLIAVPSDVSRSYNVTISTVATPPGYTISAAPRDNQASRDTDCGTLTLKQDGTKGISGTGSVSSCWGAP